MPENEQKATIAQEYEEFVNKAIALVPLTDNLLAMDKKVKRNEAPFLIYQKHLIGMIEMYSTRYGLDEQELSMVAMKIIQYIEHNAKGKLPSNWAEITIDILGGKYFTDKNEERK